MPGSGCVPAGARAGWPWPGVRVARLEPRVVLRCFKGAAPVEDVPGTAVRGKAGGHERRPSFSSAGGDNDGSCEVNGRRYRDGETFQPHCRIRCRCEDGGFTCVPLCSEDVRLPSWDCPHPRRVEVPGKCCPEWVCDQAGVVGVQPLLARGECRAGPGCGAGRLEGRGL